MYRELVSAIEDMLPLAEIQNLVDGGMDINLVSYSRTPLESAMISNRLDVFRYILNHKDFKPTGERMDSILIMAACFRADIEMFEEILNHGLCRDINKTVEDMSVLYWAVVENCDSAVVELLLDHGADVNTCCETQSPAVFILVERSNTRLLKRFIKCGVKIFISNCYAQSVIHAANASGSREVRKLLFEYIANHFSPKTNWTELADAVLDDDVKKVTDLIQKGHNVDRISLYIGILSKDSRMFNLVWDNTAPEIVERDPYFLMHVFENWPEDAELDHLFSILRKGLKLRVDTCGDQFSHFVYRDYNFVSSMAEEEWIEIIEYLLREGMRLNSTSLDLIVQTTSHESMVHFIELFIKTFQPKITQEVYATALLTHLDHKFLLQYFLEPKPDIIYAEWDLPFLLHYMGLFTFDELDKENIRMVARDNVPQVVEAVEAVLNQMNVKSLTEIARDAIRKQLNKVCFDCRQMVDILRKSKIPTPIKRIIQLQTPVNLWVYNVAAQFKNT